MQVSDPIVLYILILVFVSLVLLLIGVILLYLKLVKTFDDYRRGRDKDVDPATLIAQAQIKSQKILEEAHRKAAEMLANAQAFLQKDENNLVTEIEKANKASEKIFQQSLEEIQKHSIQMVQNIPQDIKITLISTLDNFRISLTQEVTKAQQEANNAIKQAYARALEEVESYKEERMKQVDSSILSIVKDVTEKVLSKEISLEEHEKLVLRALEEARKQNIFCHIFDY